jgi:hypothetical protein
VLGALKVADVGDRVRQAEGTVHQALIEAELTAVIGTARTSAPTPPHHPAQRPPQPDPRDRSGLSERRRRVNQALSRW